MNRFDFLLIDGGVSQPSVDRLANAYISGADRYETNHEHEFWNGRLLGYRDAEPDVRDLMLRWLRMSTIWVRDFYEVDEPLYADVLHLVGWRAGSSMPVHADNCQIDGSSNGLAHRRFSGVFYLTGADDGALTLPNQGIKLLPRAGRFVSLPCGLSHQHGVEVTSSLRITMAFFLTTDPAKADPALTP